MRLLYVVIISLCLTSQAFSKTLLSSSILLFDRSDFANCPAKVDEALRLGNLSLQVVPTLDFVSDGNENAPEVQSYCAVEHGGPCAPVTKEVIQEFKSRMTTCFQKIFEAGLSLHIMPHIDDGGGDRGIWRNLVSFDPLKKYAGFSYWDILINPLTEAVKDAAPHLKTKSVDFSMQGEMGATVFGHPSSFVKMAKRIRKTLSKYDLKVGLCFNFNKVDGGIKAASHVQKVFDVIDYVGVSAYHGVSVPPRPDDFFQTIVDFKKEMANAGVTLGPQTLYMFSELGLGGSSQESAGKGPSADVIGAAQNPWAGLNPNPYDPKLDPWIIPELKNLRKEFYRALLDFIALPKTTTHVENAYIWNAGTWDVQGLYAPAYADPDVISDISHYDNN